MAGWQWQLFADMQPFALHQQRQLLQPVLLRRGFTMDPFLKRNAVKVAQVQSSCGALPKSQPVVSAA